MISRYTLDKILPMNEPDNLTKAVNKPISSDKTRLKPDILRVNSRPWINAPATRRPSSTLKRYRGTLYHCQLYPTLEVLIVMNQIIAAITSRN